jgi:hypothetical protein
MKEKKKKKEIHILLLPTDILLENMMGRLIQWVKL